jgi:hypothetical protein
VDARCRNGQHGKQEVDMTCVSKPLSRLTGRWLLVARGVWFGLVLLGLIVSLAALPPYFEQMRSLCTGMACDGNQVTPDRLQVLEGLGISLDGYATY